MRTVLGLALLSGLVAAGAAVAQLPLAFVLDRAGLAERGLDWSRAEGTVWEGRVTGLAFGAQPIGEARLNLSPSGLFSGRLVYDVQWSGPPGRGAGTISAARNGDVAIRDLRVEADISALNGAADWVRSSGGVFRVRAEDISFEDGACKEAVGSVSSDVLTRAAAAWGQTWPEVAGDLRCEDGMLVVPVVGERAGAERIEAEARIGMVSASSVQASVTGADPELENALALIGFGYEDGAYVYQRIAGY